MKPRLMHEILFYNLHRAVVVAMVAVCMMQASVDQVVNVATMRHGRMAAIGPVDMFCVVTICSASTFIGIR